MCMPFGAGKDCYVQAKGRGPVAKQEADMANGIKTPFTVDAARAKEFLQQSADSKACENLMDKARLHIPDFYNKRVRRGGNESHK